MKLKTAIRKAISENSKFQVVKVWDVDISEDYQHEGNLYKTMIIEVQVKRKPHEHPTKKQHQTGAGRTINH